MDTTIPLLLGKGLGVAFGAGLFAFGLTWWQRRGPGETDHPPGSPAAHDATWVAPALLTILCVGLYAWLIGAWPVTPRSATEWVPLIVLLAGFLGVIADSVRLETPVKWIVRALFLAGAFALLSRNLVHGIGEPSDSGWSRLDALGWITLFTLATLACWWALARTNNRTRGCAGPALSSGLCAAAFAVLVLTGSLKAAQMCSFPAATMLAATLVSLARPRLTIARGGAHVPIVVVACSLFVGQTLGETPLWALGLLALVPFAALVPEFFRRTLEGGPESRPWAGSWKMTLARIVCGALPAGLAVAIIAAEELRKQQSAGGE